MFSMVYIKLYSYSFSKLSEIYVVIVYCWLVSHLQLRGIKCVIETKVKLEKKMEAMYYYS